MRKLTDEQRALRAVRKRGIVISSAYAGSVMSEADRKRVLESIESILAERPGCVVRLRSWMSARIASVSTRSGS